MDDEGHRDSPPANQTATDDVPPPSLVGRGGFLFRDRSGEWWRVCEWKTVGPDEALECALVFESENIVRRVHAFPDRWRELSADELENLMSSIPLDASARTPVDPSGTGHGGTVRDRTS